MRIRWTNAAAADMQSISNYLKDNHPQYRQTTMRKLYQRIRALKDAPYIVGAPSQCETQRNAGSRKRENFAQNHRHDTRALGPERHANPDLPYAAPPCTPSCHIARCRR
jgi:plasmid stabilization system protein ParE